VLKSKQTFITSTQEHVLNTPNKVLQVVVQGLLYSLVTITKMKGEKKKKKKLQSWSHNIVKLVE